MSRLALQLYTVRDECAADFPEALARTALLGFEGVEQPANLVRRPAVQVVELDALEAERRRPRERTWEVGGALVPHGVELEGEPAHVSSPHSSGAARWSPSPSTATRPVASTSPVGRGPNEPAGSSSHFRWSCGTHVRSMRV